jgi:hypothetical protein
MTHTTTAITPASPFDRAKLMQLLEVFQFAVIDIAKIEDNRPAQTSFDQEYRRYVVGVAALSAANCELLLGIAPGEEAANAALYEQFMGTAPAFAAALQHNELGKGDDDVDLQQAA